MTTVLGCWMISISPLSKAHGSALWAALAVARVRRLTCLWACWNPPKARFWWMAGRSPVNADGPGSKTSPMCRKASTWLTLPWPRTLPSVYRAKPSTWTGCGRRPVRPRSPTSSKAGRKAIRCMSANVAFASVAANANELASPGRSTSEPAYWCSTKPPAPSTTLPSRR